MGVIISGNPVIARTFLQKNGEVVHRDITKMRLYFQAKRYAISLMLSCLILLIITCPGFASVPQLGDVNDSGTVDIADVILALKAISHTDTAGNTISLNNSDFNLDGKIALEEAIFVLQIVAELRDVSISLREAAGTVVLPPGFTLPMTSLKVYGQFGSTPVGEDGRFTLPLSGSGDAMVVVTIADGTPLMMGFLTADPAKNILGAQSTAVALLFQALGSFAQSITAWADIRTLIAATPEASTLTTTIAERLAADPEAVSKKDTAISAAISSVAEAIWAARTKTSSLSMTADTTTATVTVKRSPQSAEVTHVVIQGTNPSSGVSILLSPDGKGITARNSYRRHVLVLVYRTGWADTSGVQHDTPWELIVDGPFDPVAKGAYLGATNAVGGVITSIIDFFNKSGAYTDSTWDAENSIALPMFPGIDADKIAKTFYRIVCVGDGFGDETLPSELADVAGDLMKAKKVMRSLEFFKEFLLPLIFAVIPSDQIASNLQKDEKYIETAIDIVNLFMQGVPDVATNYASGSYGSAGMAALKALSSNPTLLKKLGVLMAKGGIIAGFNSATLDKVSDVSKKALVLLGIVDKVIAAFDESVLMVQLAKSHPYEQWEATAVWPAVRVQPKPATVESGKSVQLMVTVGGETGNSDDYFYRFTWTTSGEHGKIVNPSGTAPAGTEVVMTSRSPGARINYESALDAQSGDKDAVDVVVQRVSADGSVNLGNDGTTVSVSGSHVELDPSTADVEPGGAQVLTSRVKPEPDAGKGDVYYYRWENSAQYGQLSGGSDAFESAEVKSVTYAADADKEGVDSVSLSVYRERPGAERELLGIASSMINVRNKYAMQLTPQGKKLPPGGSQVYTATLIPEPETGTQLIYTWSNTATAGHLTDFYGIDHFETSQNQVFYLSKQEIDADIAATDTVTVQVQRIISNERFSLAESSTEVTVSKYGITLPLTLTVQQGGELSIPATVAPSMPAGGYFKWTNTRQQGILTDPDSGKTDNFETTNATTRYTTMQDVNTGSDTVRVELYVDRNGTPILLGSAECRVLVQVIVATTIRKGTAECDYAKDMGQGCRAVCGAVALTWRPPAGFAPTGYAIELDTHGVYQPNADFLRGYHTPEQLLPLNEDPHDPSDNLIRATVPIGEVGEWVDHIHSEWCPGSNLTFEQIRLGIENWATLSIAEVESFTFKVWALP
jgi:hypothetical protein